MMRNFLLLVFLLIASRGARGDVRVVPESATSARLQLASLEARVERRGAFVKTTATWTFSNSSSTDFEAEMIAEAPKTAVVSGFAYWFRGEKVVARVVEKERAAWLYRRITNPAAPRDPALVEMLSRHFFRVRIAPVAAKQDLKIETVWIQPLRVEKSRLVYDFPLGEPRSKVSIPKWKFQLGAGWDAAPALGAIQNGAISGDGKTVLPASLEISTPRAPKTALVWSQNGYFALRVGAGERVASFAGGREIFRSSDAGGVTIVGRAPAKTLAAQGGAAFGDVAEKLWAAAKLDALAGDEKNRDAGIKLSTRYGLLSKWTSWLAIPASERQRFIELIEREKREAARQNLQILGPEIARRVGEGRNKGAQFVALKAQFVKNAKIVDLDFKTAFTRWADNSIWLARDQIRSGDSNYRKETPAQSMAANARLLAQIQRLRPFASERTVRVAEEASFRASQMRLTVAVETLRQSYRAGRENPAAKAEIARIVQTKASRDNSYRLENSFKDKVLGPLAREWASLPANHPKRATMLARIKNLSALYPSDAPKRAAVLQNALADAERNAVSKRAEALQKQLAQEIVAGRQNEKQAQEIRAQINAISQSFQFATPISTQILPVQDTLATLRAREFVARYGAKRDEAEAASLQVKIERLKPYLSPEYGGASVGAYSGGYAIENAARDLEKEIQKEWLALTSQPNFDAEKEKALIARYDAMIQEVKKVSSSSWVWDQSATFRLLTAEKNRVRARTEPIFAQIFEEQVKLFPDQEKLAILNAQLVKAANSGVYYKAETARNYAGRISYELLEQFRNETAKSNPDARLLAQLEKRIVELAPEDWFYQQWQARRTLTPQQFQTLRLERITVRSQLQKAAKAPDSATNRQLVAELKARDNDLRVRVGDPLLAVQASADAVGVVAIFPDGSLKKLAWNAVLKQWEARFDVPVYAGEGDYVVKIIVVHRGGARQQLQMRFAVDSSVPNGKGEVQSDGAIWKLTLSSDEFTDRVSAFTPWKSRVELKRNAEGIFEAQVEVPQQWRAQKAVVRFVLTDKAHNRTEILVDWN